MKKRVLALVFAAFMITLAGCGQAKDNNSGSGSGDTLSEPENVQQAESLNVENDKFTFGELVQQVGAAEKDVIEFLGSEEQSKSYSTELFGEKVEISLGAEDNTVRSIRLVFSKTKAESLKNAISEQLGKNGEDSGKKTEWKDESGVITLSSGDSGCVVEITQ